MVKNWEAESHLRAKKAMLKGLREEQADMEGPSRYFWTYIAVEERIEDLLRDIHNIEQMMKAFGDEIPEDLLA